MSWREFVFATIGAFVGSLGVVVWPLRRAKRELQECQAARHECEHQRRECEENCAQLHTIIEQQRRRDQVLLEHDAQLTELRKVLDEVRPALELLRRRST